MLFEINELSDLYFILPNGSSHQNMYEHFIRYKKYKKLISRKFDSGLYCTVFFIK